MQSFTFKGIGTHWSISVDTDAPIAGVEARVLLYVAEFEKKFSRFLEGSEVNQFRDSEAGAYVIGDEFAKILGEADTLRARTGGAYDPAVGGLLERAGYDKNYRLKPGDTEGFKLPMWSLHGNSLTIDGPTAFDLGGIGKGYCIDRISDLILESGFPCFIVEGGGDMFGTTKRDNAAWRVGIEWPGKTDTAAGLVLLENQGLAVSDSFRRRWGRWHHIVDPATRLPIEKVLGCAAVAPSAFSADQMTSGLFLSPPEAHSSLAKHFEAEYMIFGADDSCVVSPGWEGEVYA